MAWAAPEQLASAVWLAAVGGELARPGERERHAREAVARRAAHR
jgi:hypothetical protein